MAKESKEKRKIEKKERRKRVLAVIRRIPKGKVCFYEDIATASGIKGGKAVFPIITNMYRENPNLEGFHWHRVICNHNYGKKGKFFQRNKKNKKERTKEQKERFEKQKELLMQEGFQIEENYYISLQEGVYWNPNKN